MSLNHVVVHPLVLLSVTDHYNRVAKDTSKRTIGVLLGERQGNLVDITNAYAVPFDEDPSQPNIWFMDHVYHENMFGMFRKVNAKEKVVGWYSTGPKIRKSDLSIHQVWARYCTEPVLVIVDVRPSSEGLPTKAYVAREELIDEGSTPAVTFHHIYSEIGAVEAEEVGVEHLLRDITDSSTSTVALSLSAKVGALRTLEERLGQMRVYLENVADGKRPMNQNILQHIQDIFNLLPNSGERDFVTAFASNSNDQMVLVFLSSLVRSIVALHNLIDNKIAHRSGFSHEKDKDSKEKEKEKEKEKDKATDTASTKEEKK